MLLGWIACAEPPRGPADDAPAPGTGTPVAPVAPTTPAGTAPTDDGCDVPFVPVPAYDPDGPLCDIPEDYVASGGDPADPPCALAAGGASDRGPDDVPSTLSVATWNVRFGADQATVLDEVATTLAGVDFLLLQEVARHDGESDPPWIDQVEELADAAAMHFVFMVEWDRREDPALGGEHGVAVLSKYPLGNAAALRLPPVNDWWDEDQLYGGRAALGVDALVGCTPIRLWSVHLDTRGGQDGRALQGEAVRAEADASGTALQLAGGDLNTWTCNPLLSDCNDPPAAEAVVEDFLDEGWADGVPGDAGWTQLGEGILPQKLDWVFHRGGLVPVDGRVARDVDGSDHVPVVFRFSDEE